jgi:hypothetical protein
VVIKSSEAGGRSEELSFETPACRDMGLRFAVENWVKFWRWQSKVIEKKWQESN